MGELPEAIGLLVTIAWYALVYVFIRTGVGIYLSVQMLRWHSVNSDLHPAMSFLLKPWSHFNGHRGQVDWKEFGPWEALVVLSTFAYCMVFTELKLLVNAVLVTVYFFPLVGRWRRLRKVNRWDQLTGRERVQLLLLEKQKRERDLDELVGAILEAGAEDDEAEAELEAAAVTDYQLAAARTETTEAPRLPE